MEELTPIQQSLPATDSASSRYLAQECMQKRGFNPIERMMDLADELEERAHTTDNPYAKERITIYNSLMKYYTPQPKAIDINLTRTERYTIEAVNYDSLAEQRQAFIPPPGTYNGPSINLLGVRNAEDTN